MRGRPGGWADWSSSPNLLQRSAPRTQISFPFPPGPPTPTYVPTRALNAIHLDSGQGYEGEGNTAAPDTRPWDQPKCGVVSPDPTAAPPVKKDLLGRQVARGGRPEEGRGRRREVLTRCKAGRCRPVPAAPVPEAGGGSTEP